MTDQERAELYAKAERAVANGASLSDILDALAIYVGREVKT